MKVNNSFVVDSIQMILLKSDNEEGRNRELFQNVKGKKKRPIGLTLKVEISGRTLNHESENTKEIQPEKSRTLDLVIRGWRVLLRSDCPHLLLPNMYAMECFP